MMSELSEEEFLRITNLNSPSTFSLAIEKMSMESDMSYMDAIFAFCEERDIDLDVVPKLINQSLKDKLEVEARELNFLPKTGTLF
tara:strand:- start:1260 stop:1514 length:255 start_codon:yes stop_codon:yes gene_type:complete